MTSSELERLRESKTIVLTTYKRDGSPVATEEARVAARALARRHRALQGVLVPLTHRLMRYRTMHYELVPRGR
jgi:hypothetical protein